MKKEALLDLIMCYAQSRVDVEKMENGDFLLTEVMLVAKISAAYKDAVIKAVEGLYESKSGTI